MTPAPDDLTRATAQLRERPLPRVVEIADSVLQQSLRVARPSLPVRAAAPYDFVRVSSTALTAVLRERIDAALTGGAVRRISIEVDREEHLTSLTLDLLVQYGRGIVEVADQARSITRQVLAEILSTRSSAVDLEVVTEHVHVSDVTRGDPHLVGPDDE